MARTPAELVANLRAFAAIWRGFRDGHPAPEIRRRAVGTVAMYADAIAFYDRGAPLDVVCARLDWYARRLHGCRDSIAAVGQVAPEYWTPLDPAPHPNDDEE
jgi:hypothetical protein